MGLPVGFTPVQSKRSKVRPTWVARFTLSAKVSSSVPPSVTGMPGAKEIVESQASASNTIRSMPPGAIAKCWSTVMGIGIGVYNVHLVARVMDSVAAAEHRSTASALTSVRSIGTAFGAAIAGVVANIAGLGDATEPEAVGYAITAVYMFCCIPFGLAALLMFRFVRITLGKPGAV